MAWYKVWQLFLGVKNFCLEVWKNILSGTQFRGSTWRLKLAWKISNLHAWNILIYHQKCYVSPTVIDTQEECRHTNMSWHLQFLYLCITSKLIVRTPLPRLLRQWGKRLFLRRSLNQWIYDVKFQRSGPFSSILVKGTGPLILGLFFLFFCFFFLVNLK